MFNDLEKLSSLSKKKMNSRGQAFTQLSGLALGLLGFVLVMVIVLLILSNLSTNTQVVADANATAAVNNLTNDAADIVDWAPIVIIVSIGAVLFVLIGGFLAFRNQNQR